MIGGFIGNPIGGVINVSAIFLSATTGAYVLTGQAVTFTDTINVSAGSYALTGQSAAFAESFAATTGAYLIAGQVAPLVDSLAAVAGSYALTGQAALFTDKLFPATGAYVITGSPALVSLTSVASSPGAYSLSGTTVPFNVSMPCGSGAYAITGKTVTFSQVINGASGSKHYRGPLQIARRKITITDDEGRVRKVDLLRHLKPPPPFAPAPDWVLPKVPDVAPPAPRDDWAESQTIRFRDGEQQKLAPLPQSLLSLQQARDDNDLINFLMGTPDPLVEDIRQVLSLLHASGQLEALLENA